MVEALILLVNMLLSRCTFLSSKEASTGASLRWLPISELSVYHLGIADNGNWVVDTQEGLVVLGGNTGFGYLMAMLEEPREEIVRKLIKFSSSLGTDIDIVSIFPFVEIVKVGLAQGSDYWAELALAWYDEFPDVDKKEFSDVFSGIMNSKRSQKLRHKARKELKRIKQ